MVRLKGARRVPPASRTWISIPDGSIKRKGVLVPQEEATEFQFQMVRLKEECYKTAIAIAQISIPDGSIKRMPACKGNPSLSYFNSRWFD